MLVALLWSDDGNIITQPLFFPDVADERIHAGKINAGLLYKEILHIDYEIFKSSSFMMEKKGYNIRGLQTLSVKMYYSFTQFLVQ